MAAEGVIIGTGGAGGGRRCRRQQNKQVMNIAIITTTPPIEAPIMALIGTSKMDSAEGDGSPPGVPSEDGGLDGVISLVVGAVSGVNK